MPAQVRTSGARTAESASTEWLKDENARTQRSALCCMRAAMKFPIQIVSTDFDGTFHTDFEDPPVPRVLEDLIASLQAKGVTWVINTGRDLSSLIVALGRAQLSIWPDYVVIVEREIYRREDSQYVDLETWNTKCKSAHEKVFVQLREDLPRLVEWIRSRFQATIYEDSYSPFCLIAQNNGHADVIHEYLNDYCRGIPNLAYVRNDVYARFSHAAYNKGSALAEIGRRLCVGPDQIVAAGDHLNDLPMLSLDYARWLIAPRNAVDAVKLTVRRQCGYVSDLPHGYGVADGLEVVLKSLAADPVSSEVSGL
ncbi:MAG: HAD family phosphatase [Verrucomicrobia bacterium]|nr:HAD family phosphatase [Verrucomicrobiota bacterium]